MAAHKVTLPIIGAFTLLWIPELSRAGEGPFFITYTHQMEEPGNLEFAVKSVTGNPGGHNRFWGNVGEFEYGVKGWWTTEVYLDGQSTRGDRTILTVQPSIGVGRGTRSLRVLPREHTSWSRNVWWTGNA